ncbi:hypothetical protein A5725_20050 [Mycobacterium kubicae]|uniref:hypothetical protein n=1 Tax=Mycobacterium kubicae TaxID=120959 RepID=UPI0007FC9B7A|nr:hypothetical protein A5725_20050 [Mycobacterium kubicae]
MYREYSAAGFEDHPPACEHCWDLANPALDDYLHRDAMRAMLPPKMTEAHLRRARLCQFVGPVENAFLTADVWDGLTTGHAIPDGAAVVIALDGSFGGAYADTTAVLLATVSARPHLRCVRLGKMPPGGTQNALLHVYCVKTI